MLLLHHQILSLETLQISYSKIYLASSAKISPIENTENILVIFWNFTSTYIMTIRMVHGCARKLKCFQTNNCDENQTSNKKKIRFLSSLDTLESKSLMA